MFQSAVLFVETFLKLKNNSKEIKKEEKEMQFTPQQLKGGQRYRNTIRIGNWKEEVISEEIEAKDFLKNQNNKLNSRKYQKRIQTCQQIVSSCNVCNACNLCDDIQNHLSHSLTHSFFFFFSYLFLCFVFVRYLIVIQRMVK